MREKLRQYTQRKKFIDLPKKPGQFQTSRGESTAHAQVPFQIQSGHVTTTTSRLQGDLQDSSVYSVRSPHHIRQKSLMSEMEDKFMHQQQKEQRDSRIMSDYYNGPKMHDPARLSNVENSRQRASIGTRASPRSWS